MAQSFLLVIGDRLALAWILRTSRMAFPAVKRQEVARLNIGDELLMLTTRACFRNPRRDRTRVMGRAIVTTPVEQLHEPVTFDDRAYPRGCALELDVVAPYLDGVELAPLIPRLHAFPNKEAWPIWLRRPLLSLPSSDALLLRTALYGLAAPPEENVPTYLERIKPVKPIARRAQRRS